MQKRRPATVLAHEKGSEGRTPGEKGEHMTPTTFNGIALEETCTFCDGTWRLASDSRPACCFCGGDGMVLTIEGNELVCFLARHLSLKIEVGIK